ncbi:tetratricopeptide repeat protein [Streptomyces sp. MUM 203J]|uniref:tetratricopeptide repeat protein n=1 Tax=Streptomyces sp. MUM 203J TaxID=2791990 RepID=UPI001F03B909|nr:tetratricopeptide repeat protein [Streptomyces sp. MUM 203J]
MSAEHPAVQRASALIDLKRYDEARAALAQRLAEEPGDIHAWTLLSWCHYRTGRRQEAVDAADEALRLDPGHASALRTRGIILGHMGERMKEAEEALREAIRLQPHQWLYHADLANLVFRARIRSYADAHGEIQREAMLEALREADGIAREAIRLGPDEVYAYSVARTIADLAGDKERADLLDREILRLDPQHPDALARRAEKAAGAPGIRAAEAAGLYADALAADPGSAPMRRGLDLATYRLLRGIRWLALLCVALAGAMLDLFPQDGQLPRELPVPVGNRLWALVPMAAIWGFGAWRRYRRLRSGVQLNVRSLIRRHRWSRVVLAQAAWCMLCALLLTQVPWTERTVPQVLFWAALVPTLVTIWLDRPRGPVARSGGGSAGAR